MSAEPFIAVLIGPGGVGKGTLARRLVDADDRLWLSKSWTTRPVRATEDGSEYHFVDRATFEQAIRDDAFLEWAEFHGNLYGTPRPGAAKHDVLLEIEVQGARQVVAKRPGAIVVLLVPPSPEVQERRLEARGDPAAEVALRIETGHEEVRQARELAQHEVVNLSLIHI